MKKIILAGMLVSQSVFAVGMNDVIRQFTAPCVLESSGLPPQAMSDIKNETKDNVKMGFKLTSLTRIDDAHGICVYTFVKQ